MQNVLFHSPDWASDQKLRLHHCIMYHQPFWKKVKKIIIRNTLSQIGIMPKSSGKVSNLSQHLKTLHLLCLEQFHKDKIQLLILMVLLLSSINIFFLFVMLLRRTLSILINTFRITLITSAKILCSFSLLTVRKKLISYLLSTWIIQWSK